MSSDLEPESSGHNFLLPKIDYMVTMKHFLHPIHIRKLDTWIDTFRLGNISEPKPNKTISNISIN